LRREKPFGLPFAEAFGGVRSVFATGENTPSFVTERTPNTKKSQKKNRQK
jgi:hypothetical protein